MPRILIDVSQEWLDRYNAGVVQVLDTLDGIATQLETLPRAAPRELFDRTQYLAAQIRDLKRNVESWRLMF